MSTRQTLKNFLTDRGLSGVNTISYNNTVTAGDSAELLDEGDDLSFDPNTGKQLVNDSGRAGLVPDYLSYITSETGNKYPVDGTTQTAASSPNRGVALEPAEDQGASDVFKTTSEFPVTTNYFDDSGTPVSSLIDKIGAGTAPDGPDLIDTVVPELSNSDTVSGQSAAVTSVFKMLKKYNKYADASGATDPRFIEPTSDGGADTSTNLDDAIKLSFQRAPGDYSTANTTTSRQTPLSDMHEVAHSMLLKAAGWDPTNTAYTSANPDAFFDTVDAENFQSYPSIIGALAPDQVRPRESYGAPTVGESSLLAGAGEAIPRDGADAVYSKSSHVTYTPDVIFDPDGFSDQEKIKLSHYQAGISIVALSILIQRTINDFSDYTKNDNEMLTMGLGPFYMGTTTQSRVKPALRAISNIALINTGRFAYERCVKAGVMLYFGISLSDVATSSPVDTTIGAFVGSSQEAAIKAIAADGENQSVQDRLAQSYGFWQGIAKSCVSLMSNIENALSTSDTTLYANLITYLIRSKSLRIANVFAQIGYTYLIAHLEDPTPNSQDAGPQSESKKLNTPFSIDSFETFPGTRVMKSRDAYARSSLALAWRHNSIPSALLLPPSLIQASLDMDYVLEGPNPVKHSFSTTLQDKTYASVRNIGRIPIEVVNNLENRLDAEYVPFYFHDLRTNEIIGLHAFLDSLTDNFSATYAPTQAYGRADAVKNYSSTKRSIGFSFWVVSTSEDDFDEMWAKINKLVTLLYPQYTKGTLVTAQNFEFNPGLSGRDFKFEQPFSQVVGASPVIRLRIGDVIKSNYSRFNLSRLFGAGNTETGALPNKDVNPLEAVATTGLSSIARNVVNPAANIFSNVALFPLLAVIASPAELLAVSGLQTGGLALVEGLAADTLDYFLKNGFVNPLLQGMMNLKTAVPINNSDYWVSLLNSALNGKIFLKPSATPYAFTKDGKTTYVKITRPTQVDVQALADGSLPNNPSTRTDPDSLGSPIGVKVSISTTTGLDFPIPDSFIYPQDPTRLQGGATCEVTLDQCLFDPDGYFSSFLAGLMFLGQGGSLLSVGGQIASSAANTSLAAAGITSSSTSLISDFLGSFMRQFTSPVNNPITYAMEDSMSRGLAGVVTSMNFTWVDPNTVWDTRWNSRAPMACKITVGFDPIHDISPGLDVYGANRAPIYNVGANRLVTGDPHRDDGRKSRERFENNGREPAWNLSNVITSS